MMNLRDVTDRPASGIGDDVRDEASTMKMRVRGTDVAAIREAEDLVEFKRRELYHARRKLAEAQQTAADHTLIEVPHG